MLSIVCIARLLALNSTGSVTSWNTAHRAKHTTPIYARYMKSGATEHSSSPASTSGQESFEPKFVTGMIAERIFTGT